MRSDANTVGNTRGLINRGRWMNVGFEWGTWMKENHCPRERQVRILRAQDGNVVATNIGVLIYEDCRRASRLYARGVARVGQKGALALSSVIGSDSTLTCYVSV